jgi:hypothetical protein
MDVLAACMRKREGALILLRHLDLVWPLTVFSAERAPPPSSPDHRRA